MSVPSDPARRIVELCEEATTERGGVTGVGLGELIAQLTAESAALQVRLRVERERLLGLERASHVLYQRLSSVRDVPANVLWSRLSDLLEVYGTYRSDELARLRSGLPPLLQLVPGAPVVCHGPSALYPGGGWFGTKLAKPPRLWWSGREWTVVLHGPASQTHSRFRHNVRFESIVGLGLDSALRRDGMLVGTRLIRGFVGEFKASARFRAEVEKIRAALCMQGWTQ